MTPRALARCTAAAAAVTALAAAAACTTAGVAASGAQHFSVPATYTVTCNDGTVLTAAGGVFDIVMQQGESSSGNVHVTGTVTPRQVTLEDAQGTLYRVEGASWFGGTVNATTGGSEMTSTDHFQLIGPDGGTAGSVLTTEHVSPNGSVVSVDAGDCELPPGV